jgi:hypothetical protein
MMRTLKNNRGLFFAVTATAILAGCVSGREGAPTDFFYNFELTSPRGNLVTVCSGYGCRFETQVTINDQDLDQLRAIFARVEDTEVGEREAVQSAIAYLETRVGTEVGTSADRAKIEAGAVGDKTQQDCIDESTNTTSYLIVMEANGLLKYHKVRRPEIRGYWLDGRWPHWTAVLQVHEGGNEWAIDSWWRDNGAEPVVIPLEDWYEFDEQREDPDVPYPGLAPSGSRQS